MGRKLFSEAHASISVPSTVKCSSDRRFAERACERTFSKNFFATSEASSRSWFWENVEGSQTSSSSDRPTNQRNRMSCWIRSIRRRMLRIE